MWFSETLNGGRVSGVDIFLTIYRAVPLIWWKSGQGKLNMAMQYFFCPQSRAEELLLHNECSFIILLTSQHYT